MKKITNRKYPAGTIMNSNYDSVYKKLPENIYFLGVPNILLAWTRPWQAVSRFRIEKRHFLFYFIFYFFHECPVYVNIDQRIHKGKSKAILSKSSGMSIFVSCFLYGGGRKQKSFLGYHKTYYVCYWPKNCVICTAFLNITALIMNLNDFFTF